MVTDKFIDLILSSLISFGIDKFPTIMISVKKITKWSQYVDDPCFGTCRSIVQINYKLIGRRFC